MPPFSFLTSLDSEHICRIYGAKLFQLAANNAFLAATHIQLPQHKLVTVAVTENKTIEVVRTST